MSTRTRMAADRKLTAPGKHIPSMSRLPSYRRQLARGAFLLSRLRVSALWARLWRGQPVGRGKGAWRRGRGGQVSWEGLGVWGHPTTT